MYIRPSPRKCRYCGCSGNCSRAIRWRRERTGASDAPSLANRFIILIYSAGICNNCAAFGANILWTTKPITPLPIYANGEGDKNAGQHENCGIEPAIIVGVQTPDITDDEFSASLDELERLLETAGGRVAARLEQRKENPSPRTYIGSGKVAELATLCRKNGIRLVVFDCELSPSQIKNLEDALSVGEEVTNPEELLPGEPIFTGDIGAPEDRYMPPPAEPGPVARPAAG